MTDCRPSPSSRTRFGILTFSVYLTASIGETFDARRAGFLQETITVTKENRADSKSIQPLIRTTTFTADEILNMLTTTGTKRIPTSEPARIPSAIPGRERKIA